MIEINFNKTELANIIKEAVAEEMAKTVQPEPQTQTQPQTLHSIKALADFIGCSTVTIQKYKNQGIIPYFQVGRKVMFNTADVLKAINKRKGGKNGK